MQPISMQLKVGTTMDAIHGMAMSTYSFYFHLFHAQLCIISYKKENYQQLLQQTFHQ